MSHSNLVISHPEFVKISSLEPTDNPGEYEVSFEWVDNFKRGVYTKRAAKWRYDSPRIAA